MPPKKYKNNNQSKSQPEAGEEGENVAENQQNQEKTTKNTQPFKCACGKTYGSLAAVHTHINNKHPLQKKKFKAQIINPKKSGQIASTSIRMKDINFNESEAQLMCHADINLKAIYQYYCEVQKNLKDNEILIEINDELSDDSGIDIQGIEDNVAVKVETKRRKEIIKTLKQLQETFKMGEIINTQKEHKDLQTFKIQKFKLNLVTQLSKFFIPKFAAKIEFSLYLIHAYQKAGAQKEDMKAHIDTVLQQLWKINTKIKDQLFRYYREWNRIRYDYKNWKYQQIKNEKNAT